MFDIPTETMWLISWFCIGGLGGYGAARRRGLCRLGDYVTHFINMGGAAVVVCAFIWWWFEDETGKLAWMLCGVAFGIGLMGIPILERAIERGWRSAEYWVRSKEPRDLTDTKEESDEKAD